MINLFQEKNFAALRSDAEGLVSVVA